VTSKEIVEIKTLCLQLATEALNGIVASEHAAAEIVKAAKLFENYFGIATTEDK